MKKSEIPRAVAACRAVAFEAGLRVDDAVSVHASNRITMRLLPSDVLARVAYEEERSVASAEFEVQLARRLAETGSPVGELDPRVQPRVHLRDGFAITLWTYYDPLPSRVAPFEYAQALIRLHGGMRQVDIMTPHFTDRVAEAQSMLCDPAVTPELCDSDRELLRQTLQTLTASIINNGSDEQVLHGEPHPANLLHTQMGPLFVDLETCCRGPVEFDIAHAPEVVSDHYPGANEDLLWQCRILMLAMTTTWRWNRDDQLPNGRQLGQEWLGQMRSALDRHGLDVGR